MKVSRTIDRVRRERKKSRGGASSEGEGGGVRVSVGGWGRGRGEAQRKHKVEEEGRITRRGGRKSPVRRKWGPELNRAEEIR